VFINFLKIKEKDHKSYHPGWEASIGAPEEQLEDEMVGIKPSIP